MAVLKPNDLTRTCPTSRLRRGTFRWF